MAKNTENRYEGIIIGLEHQKGKEPKLHLSFNATRKLAFSLSDAMLLRPEVKAKLKATAEWLQGVIALSENVGEVVEDIANKAMRQHKASQH